MNTRQAVPRNDNGVAPPPCARARDETRRGDPQTTTKLADSRGLRARHGPKRQGRGAECCARLDVRVRAVPATFVETSRGNPMKSMCFRRNSNVFVRGGDVSRGFAGVLAASGNVGEAGRWRVGELRVRHCAQMPQYGECPELSVRADGWLNKGDSRSHEGCYAHDRQESTEAEPEQCNGV